MPRHKPAWLGGATTEEHGPGTVKVESLCFTCMLGQLSWKRQGFCRRATCIISCCRFTLQLCVSRVFRRPPLWTINGTVSCSDASLALGAAIGPNDPLLSQQPVPLDPQTAIGLTTPWFSEGVPGAVKMRLRRQPWAPRLLPKAPPCVVIPP